MGEIILFQKYWDRKQKKKEDIKSTEHYEYNENIDAPLNYMSSEISKTLDKPGLESFADRENKERKEFEEKYSDILTAAPVTNEGKIQYFANVMLEFLPKIFHGKQKRRFNAYMDFSEFYLSEFDTAYDQYRSKNQEYEKEYPFRFTPLDADTLEKELQDCLILLASFPPTKNSRERAEIIMWQACRLFELYHCLDDLF